MSDTKPPVSGEFLTKLYEMIQGVKGAEIITSDGGGVADHNAMLYGGAQRVFLSIPNGRQVSDITDKIHACLPNPIARTGNIELKSLASLCAYARRMREPNSVILADKDTSLLRVVFDHHDAVNNEVAAEPEEDVEIFEPGVKLVEVDDPNPQWGRFTATYRFPFSKAWKAWSGQHGQPMSQEQLAEWVEEQVDDILDVNDPAQVASEKSRKLISLLGLKLGDKAGLIQAARGLRLTINEEVHNVVNTISGEVEVKYVQSEFLISRMVGRFGASALASMTAMISSTSHRRLVRA